MRKSRPHSAVAGTTWSIWQNEDGTYAIDQATLAVLIDIREELKKINATLRCPSTQGIPRYLRRISANTAKPRKKKA